MKTKIFVLAVLLTAVFMVQTVVIVYLLRNAHRQKIVSGLLIMNSRIEHFRIDWLFMQHDIEIEQKTSWMDSVRTHGNNLSRF